MFHQLYVLSVGGVCIYSGSPHNIHSTINHISESSVQSKFALETLIKHSCCFDKQNNQTIKQLIILANKQICAISLEDTKLLSDGIVQNRQRFQLSSLYVLSLRYLSFMAGHQWKKWLFYSINYFFYALALSMFYNHEMIYSDGCINLENDLYQTCNQSMEKIDNHNLIIENLKYSFFFTIIFSFFVMVQFSLSFLHDLQHFRNEHRNGWYSTGVFYMMQSIMEIVPIIAVIIIYVYIGDLYEPIRPGIYLSFVYLFILATVAFQGMAHIFALSSNSNINILIIVSFTIFLIFSMLSNFMLTYNRLHYVYQFLSNFAISRFHYEAIILLLYGFNRCAPKEIQIILYSMSLVDDDYYNCVWMLLFNIVFYRTVAIVLLIRQANPFQDQRSRTVKEFSNNNNNNNNNNINNLISK